MQVPSPSQAPLIGSLGVPTGSSPASNERTAVEAARKLNDLQISGREYSVVRDPQSQKFVVVVLDEKTGTVLDQFPPEEILKMLAQLAAFNPHVAKASAPGETLA
ncbi:MAG TPA: flagellar protein FlaG [Bryobacteraceae bacterium]|nr:flagellar protein FlaG [Bryobacteraceae bacterium]